MTRAIWICLLAGLGLLFTPATPALPAQEDDAPLVQPGADVNPDANISAPLPVSIVRGEVEIRGSANVPDLVRYFVEYRPLNDDLSPGDATVPWLPIVLPNSTPVSNGLLGAWDSTIAPDGVYEFRLTITTGSGTIHSLARPLRIDNNPSPFAQTVDQPDQSDAAPALIPTLTLPGAVDNTNVLIPTLTLPGAIQNLESLDATPDAPQSIIPTLTLPPSNTPPPSATPTLTPSPTVTPSLTPDLSPKATVIDLQANVRSGDTVAFPVIAIIEQGQELSVVAFSIRDPNWYLVDLPDGRRGWINGAVIELTGDLTLLRGALAPASP